MILFHVYFVDSLLVVQERIIHRMTIPDDCLNNYAQASRWVFKGHHLVVKQSIKMGCARLIPCDNDRYRYYRTSDSIGYVHHHMPDNDVLK